MHVQIKIWGYSHLNTFYIDILARMHILTFNIFINICSLIGVLNDVIEYIEVT